MHRLAGKTASKNERRRGNFSFCSMYVVRGKQELSVKGNVKRKEEKKTENYKEVGVCGAKHLRILVKL